MRLPSLFLFLKHAAKQGTVDSSMQASDNVQWFLFVSFISVTERLSAAWMEAESKKYLRANDHDFNKRHSIALKKRGVRGGCLHPSWSKLELKIPVTAADSLTPWMNADLTFYYWRQKLHVGGCRWICVHCERGNDVGSSEWDVFSEMEEHQL